MRNGLLGSIAALAVGAGLAFGQGPYKPQGAGVLGGSAMAAPAQNPAAEPLNAPSPYGPDGAPVSTAEGLFGSGPVDARHFEQCWATGAYLLWTVKRGPINFPLIVSGTTPNGAVPFTPGAVTLFGGQPFDFDENSGARFGVGSFLPGSHRVGVEADGLILARRTIGVAAVSGPLGIPVLGRPFINELTGMTESINASSLSNPGSISGFAYHMMWSAELNLFANFYRGQYFSWTGLTGFRHFNLAEGFRVDQNRTIGSAGQFFQGVALPIGSTTAMEDKFDTFNHFYGWNIGQKFEYLWRNLAFDFTAQVALGDVRRSVTRQGFSEATTGPATNRVTTRVPGGLFAGITNLGSIKDNVFEAVPELRVDAYYQLSSHVRIGFGWGIIYANHVVRPGQQIDPTVNPTLVPLDARFGLPLGTAFPGQLFHSTDYWAQGVNWSLLLTF